ncbi:DUF72 domain-containing protein [Microbacterium sp. 179-I 3D3 NHS]|uniref:DUF72 domain-containing protein n=1 Tax=unclassified Microbacterium TaxID=2609290 RepID=UPI0039A19B70
MSTTGSDHRGTARVGVSGWRYARWRGDFYPPKLPQRQELEYIGQQFSTVELNGSFYSLQRPESYRRWRASVPDDFLFAVKGSRYISHMLRLQNVETALANFFASGVLALGAQLGPILWQLPERQAFDPVVLQGFLQSLPRTTGEAAALARGHDARLDGRAWVDIEADLPIRYALEPRSDTFHDERCVRLLHDHGVALAVADTAGRWPLFDTLTSDFVYVRLHGAEVLYHSGYTPEQLADWEARITGWTTPDTAHAHGRDVYVYFDNDARGHAPHDAAALAALVERPR